MDGKGIADKLEQLKQQIDKIEKNSEYTRDDLETIAETVREIHTEVQIQSRKDTSSTSQKLSQEPQRAFEKAVSIRTLVIAVLVSYGIGSTMGVWFAHLVFG